MKQGCKLGLITLLTLLSVALTSFLGCWQLSRAEEKLKLATALAQLGRMPVLNQEAFIALTPAQQGLHRKVVLTGRWLATQTVFLDNRQMQGKPGFYVLTPFQPEGGPAAVLVQRGWVPRNFLDRTSLPEVETPTGVVQIEGRIAPPPSQLYALGGAETGLIRQNLDLAQFSAQTGLSLLAVAIQQSGPAEAGLERNWPQVGAGVEKHQGYALQWFGLAALIGFLFVWFQIVKRFIFPPRH